MASVELERVTDQALDMARASPEPNAAHSQKPRRRMWIYIGVPFRPCPGTYGCFPAASLPPVKTYAFAHLRTLADVASEAHRIDALLMSPTGCRVSVEPETHVFYRDQTDCVVWRFRDDLGVYAVEN